MKLTRYCYMLPTYQPIASTNSATTKIKIQTCNKTISTQPATKKIFFYY